MAACRCPNTCLLRGITGCGRAAAAQLQRLSQAAAIVLQAARVLYTEAGKKWDRDDAAVNCGNCLCERAELAPAPERMQYLSEALACYDAGLQKAAGDAEVRAGYSLLRLYAAYACFSTCSCFRMMWLPSCVCTAQARLLQCIVHEALSSVTQ